MPANDGRGYVLRRLVRRAYRHGNLLGIEEPFVYKLVGVVGDIMKDAYPEILASLNFISKICRAEEERFAQTLSSGLRYFQHYAAEAQNEGRKTLRGEAAFKLYDTFGFPLDLSQELAPEEQLAVDEAGFPASSRNRRTGPVSPGKGSPAEGAKSSRTSRTSGPFRRI